MKLIGLGSYKSLDELILSKINKFGESPTQFSTLFELMFSEAENVFAEVMVGYKIKEITYGEVKKAAMLKGARLKSLLASYPHDSIVGLDMANGVQWVEVFWAVLLAGFRPLLINSRLPKNVIEDTLTLYGVRAVVGDGEVYGSATVIFPSELENGEGSEIAEMGSEVIFMSSGTQGELKLCCYTAERFYYQICDTYYIVKECPQIRKGYEGKIKQLALLPFYHVFGFMAVYLWFAFFSRTFVFLRDLSPQTLLNTARRHKVTHIFAVPLVWETIYKTVINTVNSRGEKTVKRFNTGLRLAARGGIAKALTKKGFAEIREQIFGDSIRFLISGGSSVKKEAIEFLNAIGYHVANGYGMTEIGITSVELSAKDGDRNSLSVGRPFKHTEYKIEDGRLLVKSSTRATRILKGGVETVTDYDEWFDTNDLALCEDGRYFIGGRADDLLVSETGENLNPNILEGLLATTGAELCLLRADDGVPTLIASSQKLFTGEGVAELRAKLESKINEHRLSNEIRRIVITSSPLMETNDFKVSRRRVAERYENGELNELSADSFDGGAENPLQTKIKDCFARILQRSASEIGIDESFFSALGGNSLDYFALIELIKEEIGVLLPIDETQKLSTVRAVEDYIQRRSL